ncbi:hypothetical protein [Glycomyces paridis]|uniref:DUF3618 domain-containing protein n=1 Tax=Glycomyces paridis TaxID=2126555 RepID=A0A4S8PIW2_9ACTN|nr:hypothetical protein [Glycomyces paridis]THV28339.1 hypothetical protein E9998_12070 [Glycomyces paridis]
MTAVPPSAAVPPGVGLAPPPVIGLPYGTGPEPTGEEERLMHQRERTLQDAEADDRKSTAELEDDAERTREALNHSVLELRERLGLDPDAEHAHGLFAPMRRHPLTVVVAAAGAATTAVVTMSIFRSRHHRPTGRVAAARESTAVSAKSVAKEALKAGKRRRKAARKRVNAAKHAIGSATAAVRSGSGKAARRLTHH